MYEWLSGIVARALRIPPAPEAPPGHEGTTRVFRASPRFFLYRLIGWALERSIALAGLAVGASYLALTPGGRLPSALLVLVFFVLGAFAVQTLFSYVALRLDYEKRWYLVTDRSLRIREGVVNAHEMTITFANIQNISISQGPLQRLFGISDVRVDTAGGAGGHIARPQAGTNLHTAFFRGVDNADRIRALMQERLRELKDAGLGDHDDADHRAGAEQAPAADAAVLGTLREIRAEARIVRGLLD